MAQIFYENETNDKTDCDRRSFDYYTWILPKVWNSSDRFTKIDYVGWT